jgi:uncharacterized protein (DUF2236 family)
MLPNVSHRLNGERAVLFGWGRAILLQLAHPLVAAGVHEHSSFRATPWAAATRLHATVRAMLALTFGVDAVRERALDGIRAIHRRVNGQLPEGVGRFPAGTVYSAEEPALVLWVHLTLLESVPLVFELLVAPLTDADRDAYCAEAAPLAIALGASANDVPTRWADAQASIERTYRSGAIAVGAQARELASAVLSPRIGRLVPPLASLNRVVTIGLLPREVRAQYGFHWDQDRQRRFRTATAALRRLRKQLPDALALWPEARQMRAAASSLHSRNGKTGFRNAKL